MIGMRSCESSTPVRARLDPRFRPSTSFTEQTGTLVDRSRSTPGCPGKRVASWTTGCVSIVACSDEDEDDCWAVPSIRHQPHVCGYVARTLRRARACWPGRPPAGRQAAPGRRRLRASSTPSSPRESRTRPGARRRPRAWLADRDPRHWPAPSAIGSILKTHGLARPPRRRPHVPRLHDGVERGPAPNDVLCTDFKRPLRRRRQDALPPADHQRRGESAPAQVREPGRSSSRARGAALRDGVSRVRASRGHPQRQRCAVRPAAAPGGLSKLLGVVWDLASASDRCGITPGEPQQKRRASSACTARSRPRRPSRLREQPRRAAAGVRPFSRRVHPTSGRTRHSTRKPPTKVFTAPRRAMPATPREPEYGGRARSVAATTPGAAAARASASSSGPFWRTRQAKLRTVADGREELRYGPVLLAWVDRTSARVAASRLA